MPSFLYYIDPIWVSKSVLYMQGETKYVYVFQCSTNSGQSMPWIIAVGSTISATQMLWCSWGPGVCDVAQQLAECSIPFTMFLARSLLHSAPCFDFLLVWPPPFHGLGIHPPNFTTSPVEYSLYEQCRQWLIQHFSHCYAALSYGGILWRLCQEDLDASLIHQGLTDVPGIEQIIHYNGNICLADSLAPQKEDLIVGVYKLQNCKF